MYFTFASLGGDPLAQMSLVGVSQCTFCVDLILFLPYVVVLCFLNDLLHRIQKSYLSLNVFRVTVIGQG